MDSVRSALDQKKIDEMKSKLESEKEEWEREKKLMLIGNTHLFIAERSARSKGPAQPERKQEAKDPRLFGFRLEEYERIRFEGIMSILQSPHMKDVPMLAQQCIQYLEIMGPDDTHVMCANHCATNYFGPNGHCNMHVNNGSRAGFRFDLCCSVIAQTAVSCGELIGNVQNFNMFEFCLTQGSCAEGTEKQSVPLVGIINLYLQAASKLSAKVPTCCIDCRIYLENATTCL